MNIDLYHAWEKTKETFKMFHYYPIIISFIVSLILLVFECFEFVYLIPIYFSSYGVYSFLWFFRFGQRKINLHDGDE